MQFLDRSHVVNAAEVDAMIGSTARSVEAHGRFGDLHEARLTWISGTHRGLALHRSAVASHRVIMAGRRGGSDDAVATNDLHAEGLAFVIERIGAVRSTVRRWSERQGSRLGGGDMLEVPVGRLALLFGKMTGHSTIS